MKTTYLSVMTLIFLLSAHANASSFWNRVNPREVCWKNQSLRFTAEVGGESGPHTYSREFVSCEEVQGKIVLKMNLKVKNRNGLQSSMLEQRRMKIPHLFCPGYPDQVEFNQSALVQVTPECQQ